MRRVLSSIGVGSATVDTVLPRERLHPGEVVQVSVELHGGDATQEIDAIYFALKTRVEGNGEVEERTLAEPVVDDPIALEPGEERSIPVKLRVPYHAPISRGNVDVWLETGLDIDWAKDPRDEDRIEVVPGPIEGALLDAIDDLGFAFRYSELVDTPYLDDRPFAQEMDFRPTTDEFATELDELEVTFMPREDDLRVFVEFDQRDAVADEYDVDFDEMEAPITFEQAEVESVRRRLIREIDIHA